jgi:lysophospholipase L1-like esterase
VEKLLMLRFPLRGAAMLISSLCVALLPVFSQSIFPDLPSGRDTLTRYESEIKAYEARDKARPVKRGETLFIGSSTFRLWGNLETEFQDLHAVNRAFGGATIDEINHYAERIVIPYKPSRIVFYAGTNDLAEGDSAKTVYEDFLEFERIVHKKLPATKIYFVSMSPGPVRVKLQKRYDETNALVSAEARRSNKFKFVDIRPVMYDGKGKLKGNLFGFDRLHMNKAGQDAWEPIIRNALAKDK